MEYSSMQIAMQVQTGNMSLHQAGAALAAALLERGHQISAVYFHDDGVQVVDPAFAHVWSSVAKSGALLLVCSTGLANRDIGAEQVTGVFCTAGLAQFFDQVLAAHRCITIR